MVCHSPTGLLAFDGWRLPPVDRHVAAIERRLAEVVEHLQLVAAADVDAAVRAWTDLVLDVQLEVLELLLGDQVVGLLAVGQHAFFDRPVHRLSSGSARRRRRPTCRRRARPAHRRCACRWRSTAATPADVRRSSSWSDRRASASPSSFRRLTLPRNSDCGWFAATDVKISSSPSTRTFSAEPGGRRGSGTSPKACPRRPSLRASTAPDCRRRSSGSSGRRTHSDLRTESR